MSDTSEEMEIGATQLEDCLVNDGYWTTRHGLRIAITKMEDSHLKNIIAMLRRRGIPEVCYLSLLDELDRRCL